MIDPKNILNSTKRLGRHEKQIISDLVIYFTDLGYDVLPHSRFDIAWGSIISDIDLLLVKENTLTLIEVKSSHDKLARIKKQFHAIQDYVDYVYVATDYKPRQKILNKVGWILVKNNHVEVIRAPKKLERVPSFDSILSLRKSALTKLLGLNEQKVARISKFELAMEVAKQKKGQDLKEHLKIIVTCNQVR